MEAVLASDSELSELSDGEEDDMWLSSDNEHKDSSGESGGEDDGTMLGANDDEWSSSDDEPLSTTATQSKQTAPKQKIQTYRFEQRRQFIPPQGVDFVPVEVKPDPNPELSPYEVWKLFVTDTMLEKIVFETNNYALQKNGCTLNLTVCELEIFLGIYYHMGLVKMPAVGDYWNEEMRYEPFASKMSRNHFYKIASYLHFVDNQTIGVEEKKLDRVWKLRPWLTSLRDNFRTVSSSDEHHSVDEIMIAFKGRSILKQYMQKTPKSGILSCGGVAVP